MLSLLWVIVCVLIGVLLGWFGRPYVTGEAERLRQAEQAFRDSFANKPVAGSASGPVKKAS